MITFSSEPRVAEQEMHALLFCLTAFGYVDGAFAADERAFVRQTIRQLVDHRARAAFGPGEDATIQDVVGRWTAHFGEVLEEYDHHVQSLLTESVGPGEDAHAFVIAKLKLRCFELFKAFDETRRRQILDTVDELMHADGVVHPEELRFRADLDALLASPIALTDAEIQAVEPGAVVLDEARALAPKQANHPFFTTFEFDPALERVTTPNERDVDVEMVRAVLAQLEAKQAPGAGRLKDATDFTSFSNTEFLDGYVHVLAPAPGKSYELIVLGDLHGCYSCLKGALLQADFFGKVDAFKRDPENNPDVRLVFLGDYIDRGKFSYSGVLRTALSLLLRFPDNVFVLRGNHEYYIEHEGRVLAPVRPAEGIAELAEFARHETFAAYMRLFEALPHALVFDRTMYVHAGIPRDATLAAKWKGLASLNDPEIRFEMLWSDPSEADFIPAELQKTNARFPFGKSQFRRFMATVGCTALVRGHERIVEGFRTVYPETDAMLLSLFSAGGASNRDLPETSNYREVTPMALVVQHRDGVSQIAPFAIDYERYNDPRYNAFFRGH